VRAAIHRHRAARVDRAGLGLDIDDAGGTEAVLRRQCPGDQRDRVGEAGLQRLAEHIDAFRQLHAVQAILQIGVVAADMQLAERILRHPGGLQQHLVQRRVVALRLVLDRRPAELVNAGAKARLDLVARDVELLGDHIEVE
jgi:hypothetical protein